MTKITDKMLRSYQPERDNYKEMKEIMDRNWKRLMKERLIKELKEELKIMKRIGKGMDEASWVYEKGIVITGNDAKYIIKELTKTSHNKHTNVGGEDV